MERLTKRGKTSKGEDCVELVNKNTYPAENFLEAEAEAICLLADYEDTGLMPEEVKNWIPCSERLPDKGYEVLVVADGYRIIGRRTPHGGWDIPADYRNVTHWMPLPSLPKED